MCNTREENEMAVDEARKGKWACPACQSRDVHIALPVWFAETQDGDLTQIQVDSEAEPLYWCCNVCYADGIGSPDSAEAAQ